MYFSYRSSSLSWLALLACFLPTASGYESDRHGSPRGVSIGRPSPIASMLSHDPSSIRPAPQVPPKSLLSTTPPRTLLQVSSSVHPPRSAASSDITVTTFDDLLEPSDGVTSLREALIQANAQPGDHRILLGAGHYRLTRRGGEIADILVQIQETGDLDIASFDGTTEIVGVGENDTLIDASELG